MKPAGTLGLFRVGDVDVGEIDDRRLVERDAMIMCGGKDGSEWVWSVLEERC